MIAAGGIEVSARRPVRASTAADVGAFLVPARAPGLRRVRAAMAAGGVARGASTLRGARAHVSVVGDRRRIGARRCCGRDRRAQRGGGWRVFPVVASLRRAAVGSASAQSAPGLRLRRTCDGAASRTVAGYFARRDPASLSGTAFQRSLAMCLPGNRSQRARRYAFFACLNRAVRVASRCDRGLSAGRRCLRDARRCDADDRGRGFHVAASSAIISRAPRPSPGRTGTARSGGARPRGSAPGRCGRRTPCAPSSVSSAGPMP